MASIPVYNPVTPFVGHIPGGLRPSLMVRIKGRISGHGRCVIDFVNSSSTNSMQDIIFHMSIRPYDNIIVRNTFQGGRWSMEERYGPCRVKKNETFEIVILAEHLHYKLAVNGHHLGVFRHRIPMNQVQFVAVSGEVQIHHILLEQDVRSAQEQMILSQVVGTPSYPQIPIHNVPIQIHTPMHVHHQHPSQVHHQQPPPPYFAQPPQPHSRITRVGGITIERRPGTIIVKQRNQNSNVFRW